MSLVGKLAPDFTAPAVMSDGLLEEEFNLYDVARNYKMVVLFFYPLDFTFVCPSEIIRLSSYNLDFAARATLAATISVDSHFTHCAYRNTPIEKGGIGKVNLPMISDITREISRNYGVLTDGGVALRGTFIIDEHRIIRHMMVNDLQLGRNIDEIVRTLDALIHVSEHGEVCPANWKKGDMAMKATQEGVSEYLKYLQRSVDIL